jgi:amino acid transporter
MFATSSVYVSWLNIPATYATAFGFIYAYGKMVVAMAESKLYPSWVMIRHPTTGAPWVALTIGSVVGYAACLVAYFVPKFFLSLFNICIFGAFMAYTAQCVSYLFLYSRLASLDREFCSPFGIYGAIFSMFVWMFGCVTVIAFQPDRHFAFIASICIFTIITIYYYTYAKSRQTFSEDEKKIMFKVHVINSKIFLY